MGDKTLINYDNLPPNLNQTDGSVSERSGSGSKTKFEVLCEGVINGLANVHEQLHSLLHFKDELLVQVNKPDRATMGPGCVSSCFEFGA